MGKARVKLNAFLVTNFPRTKADSAVSSTIEPEFSDGDAPFFDLRSVDGKPSTLELGVDMAKLGLASTASGEDIARAIDAMVLALNVWSPEAAFSTEGRIVYTPSVDRDPVEVEPVQIKRDSEGNVQIHVTETIRVSASVAVEVRRKVKLDSASIMGTATRIQAFIAGHAAGHDVIKALDKIREAARTYEEAQAVDRYAAAIELFINGTRADELRGEALDAEVAARTSVSKATAENVRRFYNRNKHADMTPQQEAEYRALKAKVPELVVAAKRAAGELALHAL